MLRLPLLSHSLAQRCRAHAVNFPSITGGTFAAGSTRRYAGLAPPTQSAQLNVFNEPMAVCCTSPLTGFFRTGSCETDEENDVGRHTVCVLISNDFLKHQKAVGNDLITPRPEFGFVGLKEGDRWCVCASRWKQSVDQGVVAKVILHSTNVKTLRILGMTLEELLQYSA
ncbi:hypothetical protein BDR26DRAFT_214450 [Obelidium mucronatum]|nr:hypothetical protein BDR26DRAFT_214450 [Obelidium mucronatum]